MPQRARRVAGQRQTGSLSPVELRSRRRALDLTQRELAVALGVTSTTVARWERGEQTVGNPEMVKLALIHLEQRAARGATRSFTAPFDGGARVSGLELANADFENTRAGQARPRRLPPRTNLPFQMSSFVGREREISELRRLLAETRLVTITGPGGMGKTRLAVEVAAGLVGKYGDGVWLVELTPVSDGEWVPQAVAAALNLAEQERREWTETLTDSLKDRKLLVVLDNCEHLALACAELVDVLLTACPGLCILATSRESLLVSGETVLPLGPLTHERGDVDAGNGVPDAMRLFVERVRASQPRFALDEHNTQSIAELCARLDGIPLAIELAAARAVALSPTQIAEHLDDRFRLLSNGHRAAPARHQTLHAALQWSFDLLTDDEQHLFERLSVFSGGCDLDAALVVAGGEPKENLDLIDGLTRLVSKSLVIAEPTARGVMRFHMLETLRQFAALKLVGAGDDQIVLNRHANYFLDLAEQAEAHLDIHQTHEWPARLRVEHDNLQAALSRYCQVGQIDKACRLTGALWRYWDLAGQVNAARVWIERLLSLECSATSRAELLVAAASLDCEQGYNDRARRFAEDGLTLSRALGNDAQTARLLWQLGLLEQMVRRFDLAMEIYDQAIQLARVTANPLLEATILGNVAKISSMSGRTQLALTQAETALDIVVRLGAQRDEAACYEIIGYSLQQLGRYAEARAALRRGISLARSHGVPWLVARLQDRLAQVFLDIGDFSAAHSAYMDVLRIWQELGNKLGLAGALEGMGHIAAHEREPVRALRLAAAAAAVRDLLRMTIPLPRERMLLKWLPRAQRSVAGAVADAARAEGAAMTLDDAIAYACGTPPPHKQRPPGTEDVWRLTPREREVARLVRCGKTDADIAAALVISRRTSETHVRNIMAKLGVDNRVEVATWVVEHDLTETEAVTELASEKIRTRSR
jgi:predicted ATPase/DNA-binding CsgD family transcriptional regulator/DNA-binding transcriptional regulator YiaG